MAYRKKIENFIIPYLGVIVLIGGCGLGVIGSHSFLETYTDITAAKHPIGQQLLELVFGIFSSLIGVKILFLWPFAKEKMLSKLPKHETIQPKALIGLFICLFMFGSSISGFALIHYFFKLHGNYYIKLGTNVAWAIQIVFGWATGVLSYWMFVIGLGFFFKLRRMARKFEWLSRFN